MDLNAALQLLNSLTSNAPAVQKLGYVFSPDQIALSYSRLQTFYSCPRKFQIKELTQSGNFEPSLDTAFGHAFGAGVQELWRSSSLECSYLAAIAAWNFPSFDDVWGKKKDKSFYCCLRSLEDYFHTIYTPQAADGWQLLENGIETLCYIQVTPRVNYQAHIDLILEHKEFGSLKLVELKTSSRPHVQASWQNSLQTKGYYAILNYIAHKLERSLWPEIEYHCLQSGKLEDPLINYGLSVLSFRQQEVAPGEFVLTLLQDVGILQRYCEDGYFPLRGNSCREGWGICEFFGECNKVSNFKPVSEGLYESLTLDDCHWVIQLDELIDCLKDLPEEEF